MSLMKIESDSCYNGPENDERWWYQYRCNHCGETFDLTDRELPTDKTLMEYNIMRFSV